MFDNIRIVMPTFNLNNNDDKKKSLDTFLIHFMENNIIWFHKMISK